MNILNVVQSAGVVENILSGIQSGWNWVLLTIDSVVYRLVSWLCDIFFGLAKINLFNNDFYSDIVRRIYIILGLVMMFILAYTLLQAVINPDNFAKGENSFGKIAMNVVVSLVIIVVLPTVFSLAYNIQNSLLEYQVVEKIVMGFDEDADYNSGAGLGRLSAYYVMSAFFHPEEDWCSTQGVPLDYSTGDLNTGACAALITSNDESTSLSQVANDFLEGDATLSMFSKFSEAVTAGEIDYSPFLSLIAAIAVAYVFLSFCFDMGIRVVKLMYFEIIAPIPVVCRVIPGGNMKSVFNDWVKKIISTYLEVFIRLFTVYICLYLIQILLENGIYASLHEVLTGPQAIVAWAFIIMGIFAFMRQAPKLISEMFHLDSGNMSLGIMSKLAAGGGLIAGAAIGGAAGSLVRNSVSAVKRTPDNVNRMRDNISNAKGIRKVGAAIGGVGSIVRDSAGSIVTGTASGAVRGGFGARGAKNAGDLRNASSQAVKQTTERRESREAYRASHPGFGHVIAGHVSDTATRASRWAGWDNSLKGYQEEQEFIKYITDIDSNSDSVAIDLMGRDAISQSRILMNSAAGINMSYDAMKEYVNSQKNKDSADLIRTGSALDLNGNRVNITNDQDYANYIATLNAQSGKAERDLKKFVKQQGYQGQSGISYINTLLANEGTSLGDGELQRFAKLSSDQENISTFIADNKASITAMNDALIAKNPQGAPQVVKIDSGSQLTGPNAWDNMDILVNNAKNRNIQINADVEKLKREEAKRGGDNKK